MELDVNYSAMATPWPLVRKQEEEEPVDLEEDRLPEEVYVDLDDAEDDIRTPRKKTVRFTSEPPEVVVLEDESEARPTLLPPSNFYFTDAIKLIEASEQAHENDVKAVEQVLANPDAADGFALTDSISTRDHPGREYSQSLSLAYSCEAEVQKFFSEEDGFPRDQATILKKKATDDLAEIERIIQSTDMDSTHACSKQQVAHLKTIAKSTLKVGTTFVFGLKIVPDSQWKSVNLLHNSVFENQAIFKVPTMREGGKAYLGGETQQPVALPLPTVVVEQEPVAAPVVAKEPPQRRKRGAANSSSSSSASLSKT